MFFPFLEVVSYWREKVMIVIVLENVLPFSFVSWLLFSSLSRRIRDNEETAREKTAFRFPFVSSGFQSGNGSRCLLASLLAFGKSFPACWFLHWFHSFFLSFEQKRVSAKAYLNRRPAKFLPYYVFFSPPFLFLSFGQRLTVLLHRLRF